MADMNMLEAIRQAMDEELARDERVFIVGVDVGASGGVFRATEGLQDKYTACAQSVRSNLQTSSTPHLTRS